MYKLTVNGEEIGTYETREKALIIRNDVARETLMRLYEDEIIDKYAFQEWGWELINNHFDELHIDEAGGYTFEISAVKEIHKFNSTDSAIEYYKHLGLDDFEIAEINGKKTIVCGSCRVYDDPLWGAVFTVLEKFEKQFEIPMDTSGIASDARDYILNRMRSYGYEFLDINDEF